MALSSVSAFLDYHRQNIIQLLADEVVEEAAQNSRASVLAFDLLFS
jgi:hypothetical protein